MRTATIMRSTSILVSMASMAIALATASCADGAARASGGWDGTVDTLATGQVVVRNTSRPVWSDEQAWRVVEELRIGRVDGDGPDLLGRIASLAVDGAGRIWVLEGQAQEIRVFDANGAFVRTVGQRGNGPGELADASAIHQGPDARMWVMDPRNARLSVFDTAGAFLRAHPARGGFFLSPWPGRFDRQGGYHAPVPRGVAGEFRVAMVRYDSAFEALDTLDAPVDPVERQRFELSNDRGMRMMAGIPYTGGLRWLLSEQGNMWALFTDEYRLFELSSTGDTLRTITRAFAPISVTAADRERAREDLAWFTDQGGQIDMSQLPATKAPVDGFFFDDEGHVWVARVASPEEEGRLYDVFDPEGRFLGMLTLPFALEETPVPVIRGGAIYAVTQDELEVPYVVRARIEKGAGR
ncbi:MAG TPA: 6-bladed beta-propeller [Longimicrobiales bacterium]|nr:6-bladed beta-propeller [Longimicrobiales bacterium]